MGQDDEPNVDDPGSASAAATTIDDDKSIGSSLNVPSPNTWRYVVVGNGYGCRSATIVVVVDEDPSSAASAAAADDDEEDFFLDGPIHPS